VLEGEITLNSKGSLSKVFSIIRSTILQCSFVDWGLEQRRPKYQGATKPEKCATQPVLGDRVIEGKEIDLVLFYMQLLGLWRLASSLLLYLGRYLHAQLIYFIYIIPDLQIYCMRIFLLSK
jgi:hypothetical protein